ncbi:MAG: right-handed parallel beta-helix repeat-containing protein, partial [Thermoplasmatales archaeon]|nr:right-handed parallel beta-helix repeat-containing protein [Thermoplasmatales archaeon]
MKKLVVIGLFIILAVTLVVIENADSEISGTPPSETGDTIIENVTVWRNEIITLNGNLIINETGNLTLDNTTLKMNCSYDGEYYIEVQTGGEMCIYNNSNITSANPDYHYRFSVEEKSKLVMENTTLSYCGYAEYQLGLSIYTDDARIKNCTIEKNYCGIYLSHKETVVPRIENNTIKNNQYGIIVYGDKIAPYIANNTITSNEYGIKYEVSLKDLGTPAYITNNEITLNNYGIKCTGDFSTITGNIISHNNISGIYCNKSHATIENNDLSFNQKGIEYVKAYPQNREIIIRGNNIENSSYGIFCSDDPKINIYDNSIKNSSVSGIEIYKCGEGSGNVAIVEKNNLNGNKIGIKYSADGSLIIKGNNINNSANEGIYCYNSLPVALEIEENNIKNSVGPGIYCSNALSFISKNTLSNNSWGIRLLGESARLANNFEDNRDGMVWQEWTIGVNVKNEVGDPIPNATVRATNCSGYEVHNVITDEKGYVSMNLTDHTFNNDGDRKDYNPYNITAYKENVGFSSTVVTVMRNFEIYPVLKIPELTAQEISFSGNLSEDQIINVNVNITNNGTLTASDVFVEFFCDNNSNPIGNLTIGIPAGGWKNVFVPWCATKGNHTFKIEVDPKNKIDEKNEDDNVNISMPIYINAKPEANYTVSSGEVYTYQNIVFNATSSNDSDGFVKEYYFDFGDGENSSWVSSPVISHNYTNTNYTNSWNYTPKIKVRDNFTENGFFAESNWVSVATITVLNRLPVANITTSATGYTNEPTIFDATNSYDNEEIYEEFYGEAGHEIIKYFWDFDDGTNATGKIVSHTYLENGTYNVTLTVWDKENATNTTWMSITVGIRSKPLPTWLELYYKQVFLLVAVICCAGAVFFSGKWYIQAKRREKEVELWVEKKATEKEEKMKKVEQRIKEWGEKQEAKKKVKEEKIELWAKRKEEKKRAMEEKLREWAKKKEEEKSKG